MRTPRKILGVPFSVGTADQVVELAVRGGLVVVPSAPVLVEAAGNPALRQAIEGADLAVADSGLMILLWRLLAWERLERVSGLEYLKVLLARPELRRPGAVFWVMPTTGRRQRNLAWLTAQGYPSGAADCYIAPIYGAGDLRDEALLAVVQERRPAHIIIALGGGVQERLGYFLIKSLGESAAGYRPGIHCIGAAIGFLSGDQVRIPRWADYLYLGWLVRCLSAPRRFVPRYWRALHLIPLMIRYREKSPV